MSTANIYQKGLRIAVEGCGHGELNAIYDSIQKSMAENNFVVDLLIICGDFQAMRNRSDLAVMSCPPKYRQLGDFHEYYSGKRKAPILTLFIGGNHESSSYLWELYHGGWVAPNIYYLGAASVIKVGNVRIGGLTGIYKAHDYLLPRLERLPYSTRDIKSAYHVRRYDAFKLFQVSSRPDIIVSHDWPNGVEQHGNTQALIAQKPFFRAEIERGDLGSPPAWSILRKVQPRYWFSAHLHVKFAALINHSQLGNLPVVLEDFESSTDLNRSSNPDEVDLDTADTISPSPNHTSLSLNPDELDLSVDEYTADTLTKPDSDEIKLDMDLPLDTELDNAPLDAVEPNTSLDKYDSSNENTIQGTQQRQTRFLALDKCLPKRQFLQILTIDAPPSLPASNESTRLTLSYDPEWLAITRFMNSFPATKPDSNDKIRKLSQKEISAGIDAERLWVEENLVQRGKLNIPVNFEVTAPVEDGAQTVYAPVEYKNNQTVQFCELLKMENWVWKEHDSRHTPQIVPGYLLGGIGGRGSKNGGHGRGVQRGGHQRGGQRTSQRGNQRGRMH